MADNKYVAYSDESKHNDGRYRSISVVSLIDSNTQCLQNQILGVLDSSDVKEFKWSKLESAKYRFAANKIIKLAIEQINRGLLRIDTLTWDIEDSRHKVKERDDIVNLGIMYYKIYKNVIQQRWMKGGQWNLKPDEQSSINWKKLGEILNNSSLSKDHIAKEFEFIFNNRSIYDFNIKSIDQVQSDQEPIIQLADLFAGLGNYSISSHQKYIVWKEINSPQENLFSFSNDIQFSRSDKERFLVISELENLCSICEIEIRSKHSIGFHTPNPKSPLNFWLYNPQAGYDKAPVKNRF